MMEANEYDLVVIGSGPAGQKAAICAAKMRKKVAIIDRKRTMGGVCVHTGTIPSKTLREAVLYLSGFRQRTFYGRGYVLKDRIAMSDLTFRAQAVMLREVEVIKAQLRRNFVTTCEGDARFLDPHTIEVRADDGSQLLRGQHIMIACGTRPAHSDDIPRNHWPGIRLHVCRAGRESHAARPAPHSAGFRRPGNH
jgi:NAD(P) transhydrogenase